MHFLAGANYTLVWPENTVLQFPHTVTTDHGYCMNGCCCCCCVALSAWWLVGLVLSPIRHKKDLRLKTQWLMNPEWWILTVEQISVLLNKGFCLRSEQERLHVFGQWVSPLFPVSSFVCSVSPLRCSVLLLVVCLTQPSCHSQPHPTVTKPCISWSAGSHAYSALLHLP